MVALGTVGRIGEVAVGKAEGGDVRGVGGGAVAEQGGHVRVVLQAGQDDVQLHSLNREGEGICTLLEKKS